MEAGGRSPVNDEAAVCRGGFGGFGMLGRRAALAGATWGLGTRQGATGATGNGRAACRCN